MFLLGFLDIFIEEGSPYSRYKWRAAQEPGEAREEKAGHTGWSATADEDGKTSTHNSQAMNIHTHET